MIKLYNDYVIKELPISINAIEESAICKKISGKHINLPTYTITYNNDEKKIKLQYERYIKEFDDFDEDNLVSYTKQLLSVLSYLHSCGILHRDIRNSNIMIDKNNNIKLIDFGLAFSGVSYTHKYKDVVTYMYRPQWLKHVKTYDYKIDVFALGMVLFYYICDVPFPDKSKWKYADPINWVSQRYYKYSRCKNKAMNNWYRALIIYMLSVSPTCNELIRLIDTTMNRFMTTSEQKINSRILNLKHMANQLCDYTPNTKLLYQFYICHYPSEDYITTALLYTTVQYIVFDKLVDTYAVAKLVDIPHDHFIQLLYEFINQFKKIY